MNYFTQHKFQLLLDLDLLLGESWNTLRLASPIFFNDEPWEIQNVFFFLNWYPNIWHLYFKVKNFSIFHKIMLLHTHTVNKTDCHFYTSFSKSHKLSNTHSHSCHCPKQHLFVSYTSTSSSYSAEKLFKFETW